MRVTALEPEPRHPERFRLFVDGVPVGVVSAAVAAERRLRPGLELTAADLALLDERETLQRALDRALRFLAHRPRSERELREYLARRVGADAATTDAVLERLRDLRLADDAAFARFWTEQRATFSPRARRTIAAELRQRGVDREQIQSAIDAAPNDDDAALAAAARKARSLPRDDYARFRAKMEGHLLRRGFGFETVRGVVNRLWAELGGEASAVDEEAGA